jgi:hypothetical protein
MATFRTSIGPGYGPRRKEARQKRTSERLCEGAETRVLFHKGLARWSVRGGNDHGLVARQVGTEVLPTAQRFGLSLVVFGPVAGSLLTPETIWNRA